MNRPALQTNQPTSPLASSGGPMSDPSQRQVDSAALDYLVTEFTHTLKHSSKIAHARFKRREKELIDAGYVAPHRLRRNQRQRPSTGEPSDEEDVAARQRLENIGVIVGGNLAERLTRSRSTRFTDPLDTIKFLCKDVWTAIWDKPVDNLRTNHRGVYVLQDNSFKPLLRISSPQGSAESLRQAHLYLAYPAGLIKGALQRLGIPGAVIPEVTTLPQCEHGLR
ncbi:transport protein particle component [Cantharellus anzutake]|uniref:transport protein particle component n=1 Tax=Cantharellus anzutake TaxID=1750568 RepID=UPI001903FF03|nr:transport protein particle component [Cantharellus anzutake]KAF8330327.1 transport protein particle component [Cantharellus anzutake]